MRKLLLVVTTILFGLLTINSYSSDFDHDYKDLGVYLSKNVKDGKVDYKSIKSDPKGVDTFLDISGKVTEAEYNSWNKKEQLTFLINLYNVETIKLIIDNYPLKSIKDIGKPWDLKVVELFGKKISLNSLENGLIREDFNEPRIHFALVCAAKGCPELISESYKASNLDKQLESSTRAFLSKTKINRLEISNNTIFLSPLFDWYGVDFKKKSGSVKASVLPYLTDKKLSQNEVDALEISYTNYDWSLNNNS